MPKKIDYELVYKDLIEKLKNINTKTDLRFRKIESCTKSEIKISCFGHEVGGSYVHDYEVTPKYIEDIKYTVNRQVIWTGRDSSAGGFGSDVYLFTIYPKHTINANDYRTKGEILRVENMSAAFEYEGGHTWALLYIFTRELKSKDNILNKFNIKIKNEDLIVEDIKIAHIVKYLPERDNSSTNCGRTLFNATFDVFFKNYEIEQILCDKYKEIVNYYFKDIGECKNVHTSHDYTYGDRIVIDMSNKFRYKVGSNWYILNDKTFNDRILRDYKVYESNRRMVTLPSGTEVEILNEQELYNILHRHDTAKNVVNMMLKHSKISDLTKEDINFLTFKLYRYYPNISFIQALVL